jgi:DNA repair protein RadC
MALLSPREIYQRAITAGAIATVISHNHPSGNVEPSEEVRKITVKIRDAGDIIGVRLLDHIIVSDHDFYSFNDRGCL